MKTIELSEALGSNQLFQRINNKVDTLMNQYVNHNINSDIRAISALQVQVDNIQESLEEMDKEVAKHTEMLAQAATCISNCQVAVKRLQETIDGLNHG